jgi:hypothetical protein
VGGDSSGNISNKVTSENAALGFRVKSGWAAVVLLTGSTISPTLRDNRVIDFADPQSPETRQPYHAAIGELETDPRKVSRRANVVRDVTQRSIANLLAGYRRKGYLIDRASLVVGSDIDPASVANPHIRAHAFEGQLFRSVLDQALRGHKIHTAILLERDAYDTAAQRLKKSSVHVRETIQNLGRFTGGPWRAEQKLAALAAWFSLADKFALGPIRRS